VRGAQLQLDLGVGGVVVDAQLERRPQRADRLAERQRGVCEYIGAHSQD
jgi:hypothetical protein